MQTVQIDRTKEWTAEDYLLLGETKTPCQLINGELIMSPAPTPYHQRVVSNLNDFFKSYAKKVGGEVYFAPIDLYIDSINIFQPDLLFLSKEDTRFVSDKGVHGPPSLVVEVVSPSNVFSDRSTKKKIYLDFGVKEYWIVDPGNKTLEVYLKDQSNPDVPHLYLAGDGLVTSTVLTELSFDLKEIF